jgi:predicted choloylglycine hydrolase
MTGQDFYLDLTGTSRELGCAHGESLRPIIRSAIERWQGYLAEATDMPFARLMASFSSATDYRKAIQNWAPHLAEEVSGIAAGAGLDEDLIFMWQMVDEVMDYVIEYVNIEKCSTLGGYDQGPGLGPVLGKTQDLPHCYLGSAAVVRTRNLDSGADILNSTIAGIICQDGMSRYLGVCLNHVGQLDRSHSGLPVTFVARLLLEQCADVEQGALMLGQVTHASGMNYGLVDNHVVRSFEVSANHVEEFRPAPELKRIWHTNHPLVNTHYCDNINMWNRLRDGEAGNTEARCNFLRRELSIAGQPVTAERAMELLSSREVPVSAHEDDEFPTVNGMVMEFSEDPTLFFAPGPPSRQEFVAFKLD